MITASLALLPHRWCPLPHLPQWPPCSTLPRRRLRSRQVYERSAIQAHLEHSTTDPLTRQPLLNK